MRISLIFTALLTFLLLISCKDLILLHKNIDYPVPSADEMRKVYMEHQPVYDSIATLSLALFDHPKVKKLCINSISIYPNNLNFAFSSCPANKGIIVSSQFEYDSAYQALVKE